MDPVAPTASPATGAPPQPVVDAIAQAIGDGKARAIRAALTIGIPALASLVGFHQPIHADNPAVQMMLDVLVVTPLLQGAGKFLRNKGWLPAWVPLALGLMIFGAGTASAATHPRHQHPQLAPMVQLHPLPDPGWAIAPGAVVLSPGQVAPFQGLLLPHNTAMKFAAAAAPKPAPALSPMWYGVIELAGGVAVGFVGAKYVLHSINP